MRTTTVALATLSTAALFLVAACSSPDGSAVTTTPVVTETETAAPSSTPGADESPGVDRPDPTAPAETSVPAISPLGQPDMERKRQPPAGNYDMSVTAVRVAEHETFTRVVFDIAGQGSPGWWVNYRDNPAQQASGLPVELAGDSFLEINIDGIAYPMDAAEPGVNLGSFPGAGIVQEVKLTTIFEAQAQFFIGISGGYRDYSVTLLEDPARVVVDFVHE